MLLALALPGKQGRGVFPPHALCFDDAYHTAAISGCFLQAGEWRTEDPALVEFCSADRGPGHPVSNGQYRWEANNVHFYCCRRALLSNM